MGWKLWNNAVGKVDLELTQFYDFAAFRQAYLRPLANEPQQFSFLCVCANLSRFFLTSNFNQQFLERTEANLIFLLPFAFVKVAKMF